MNQLQEVSAQMLEIERINMAYNEATNFGLNPNGQEAYIKHLLCEWDHLKHRRQRLKECGMTEESPRFEC